MLHATSGSLYCNGCTLPEDRSLHAAAPCRNEGTPGGVAAQACPAAHSSRAKMATCPAW
jgi:hypothetical protein